ncbi:MAG: type IV pilus twitching motility protein PilT [Phycisphaerae bacterium]
MPDPGNDRLVELLLAMADREASDLHLVAGYRPMYRIHGELASAGETPLQPGEAISLVRSLAPADVTGRLDAETDLDFAIQIDNEAGAPRRFRVNVFCSQGDRGACFRAIADSAPILSELGFPVELGERILSLKNGLVLLTGITGSGKTTSLAALIQILNERGGTRIITIEEPIEYIYTPASDSIVSQREVGRDVASFYDGLRFGLRQDPDVLLVGEIRDRETAQLALSAAETGHLIFATLHTIDAKGAITRLVDLFPSEMHQDVRTQLAMNLRFVIAQHLLPSGAGGRRTLAMEVLFANFAVRSAIRQGKIENVESAIQSGRKDGMYSLDTNLRQLVEQDRISLETARAFAKDPTEFGGLN